MSSEDREDSGVIDLFAICARASATPARDMSPPDLFSVAPLTTDVAGDDDDDLLANPFAKRPRRKIGIIAGAVALVAVAIVFVSVSGGSAEAAKASAAGRPEPTTHVVVPAAAPSPAAPQAPVASGVAVALPPPPTTGAPVTEKAPPRPQQPSILTKPKAPAGGGPKMTKVQSGGVPAR